MTSSSSLADLFGENYFKSPNMRVIENCFVLRYPRGMVKILNTFCGSTVGAFVPPLFDRSLQNKYIVVFTDF